MILPKSIYAGPEYWRVDRVLGGHAVCEFCGFYLVASMRVVCCAAQARRRELMAKGLPVEGECRREVEIEKPWLLNQQVTPRRAAQEAPPPEAEAVTPRVPPVVRALWFALAFEMLAVVAGKWVLGLWRLL